MSSGDPASAVTAVTAAPSAVVETTCDEDGDGCEAASSSVGDAAVATGVAATVDVVRVCDAAVAVAPAVADVSIVGDAAAAAAAAAAAVAIDVSSLLGLPNAPSP